jgi:hypothetical protein
MTKYIPVLLLLAMVPRLDGQIEVISNGNVGIGTTSPFAKLTLGGTGPDLTLINQDGTNNRRLNFKATDSEVYFEHTYSTSMVPWNFRVGGLNAMTIHGGNVGVGTTTPTYHLQVESALDNQFQVVGKGTGFGGSMLARIYSERTSAAPSTDVLFQVGSAYAPTALGVFGSGNVGVGTTGPAQKLAVFGTNGAPASSGSSADGVLRLGSSVTNLVLDAGVNGGAGAYTWLQARSQASYAESYPISINPNGGNVGIGTVSPSTGGGFTPKLQLTGDYTAVLLDATVPGKKWGLGVDSNGGFHIFETTSNIYSDRLLITNGGNMGIGTISPTHKLHVAGTVRAASFISDTSPGGYADFVFKSDYRLPALSEIEAHIKERGHLPGIPSEAEAREQGIDLARMQVQLLQKIEELTLHQIAQEKRLNDQSSRLQNLETENARLRGALTR